MINERIDIPGVIIHCYPVRPHRNLWLQCRSAKTKMLHLAVNGHAHHILQYILVQSVALVHALFKTDIMRFQNGICKKHRDKAH